MKKTLTALLASSVITEFAQFPVVIASRSRELHRSTTTRTKPTRSTLQCKAWHLTIGQAIAAQRAYMEQMEAMKRQREIIERQAEEIRKMTG